MSGRTKNKATRKQTLLLKEMTENPGNKDMGEMMINAGYSKQSARNPKKILESPGFVELMDSYGLTDSFLVRQIKNGLTKAFKPVIYEGEITGEYPDYHAKHKYLETALKVKGHLQNINQTNILAQDFDIEIINEPMTKPDEPFKKN